MSYEIFRFPRTHLSIFSLIAFDQKAATLNCNSTRTPTIHHPVNFPYHPTMISKDRVKDHLAFLRHYTLVCFVGFKSDLLRIYVQTFFSRR